MFEVEKKFKLNSSQIKKLTKGAKFLGERKMTDIYFDTDDFRLIKQDIWLRSRNGKFELKTPLNDRSKRKTDQYEEIEDETKIKKILDFDVNKSLKNILSARKYLPFCTCKTTHQKFKIHDFIIDLDQVDFGEFKYRIGEIELMVKNKSEILSAEKKILDFAQTNNLKIAPVRGKVLEYLKRIQPQDYNLVIDTWRHDGKII